MKKILTIKFLLLINVFSLYAQNTNETNELTDSYKVLTESKSFIDFEKSAREFMSNANHHSWDKTLTYESKFLEDLELRVSSTKFKDFDEAKRAYENVKQKFNDVKKENTLFFEQLKKSKNYSLAELMTLEIVESGYETCDKSYKNTLKMSAFSFESTLRYKENSSVTAWMLLENKKRLLKEAYEMCVLGSKS
ncbi:hypothetical protein [Flavobacterium alkalisoli]|uniref:hypothetical protein n=1 Tax=Flavobacterium alkalisoli TaxID=2602769 RepID=UPI003A924AD8